jgi:hypothetical protein
MTALASPSCQLQQSDSTVLSGSEPTIKHCHVKKSTLVLFSAYSKHASTCWPTLGVRVNQVLREVAHFNNTLTVRAHSWAITEELQDPLTLAGTKGKI